MIHTIKLCQVERNIKAQMIFFLEVSVVSFLFFLCLKSIRQVFKQSSCFSSGGLISNSAQGSWKSYLTSVNSAAAEGIWHLWISVTLWGCGRQHCTVDALARLLQPPAPCQRALGCFAWAQCSTQLYTQQLTWLRGEGLGRCVGLKKT